MSPQSIKLVYLGNVVLGDYSSPRIWDVVRPVLPGYDYNRGYPSLSLEGLQEFNLLQK